MSVRRKTKHMSDKEKRKCTKRIAVVLLFLLFGGCAIAALILAIQSRITTDTQSADIRNAALQITTLQLQVLQTQIELNSTITSINGTTIAGLFPGASVQYQGSVNPIYFSSIRDHSATWPVIPWDVALWDDSQTYWSSSAPEELSIAVTGRYGIGLTCTRCCQITGYDVTGQFYIVYSSAAVAGGGDCAVPLAGEYITGAPALYSFVGPTIGYSVSMYVEAELTGGNGEWLGASPVLVYDPPLDFNDPPPVVGSDDRCQMLVRYLGPAEGTPLTVSDCSKKKKK